MSAARPRSLSAHGSPERTDMLLLVELRLLLRLHAGANQAHHAVAGSFAAKVDPPETRQEAKAEDPRNTAEVVEEEREIDDERVHAGILMHAAAGARAG